MASAQFPPVSPCPVERISSRDLRQPPEPDHHEIPLSGLCRAIIGNNQLFDRTTPDPVAVDDAPGRNTFVPVTRIMIIKECVVWIPISWIGIAEHQFCTGLINFSEELCQPNTVKRFLRAIVSFDETFR
jgi:hypothetical protein